MFHITETRA